MARQSGTDSKGGSFPDEIILKVWRKGSTVIGYNPDAWRFDKCYRLMGWDDYGNRQSGNGWVIDHIKPLAKSGTDNLDNLQPLNWNNNASKGDQYPWECPKKSS